MWFYRCCVLLYCIFGYWIWPKGLKPTQRHAKSLQSRFQTSVPAIKSALVEFHKAQCFFMLAIEIAAQVVVRGKSLSASSTSLQSLYNNYMLIGCISISGFLPITFTQLCLHDSGMRSWYLLIMSTLTVIASATTLYTAGSFRLEEKDVEGLQSLASPYPSCGRRDPSAYCFRQNPQDYIDAMVWDGGTPILIFCLIVLTALIADKLGLRRSSYYEWLTGQISIFTGSILRELNSTSPVSRVLRFLRLNTPEGLYIGVVNMLFFGLWSLFLIFFLFYLARLALIDNSQGFSSYIRVISMEWTFGQIIGLTVWAAPLIECLKLLYRK